MGDETKVKTFVLEPPETKFVIRMVTFLLIFFVAVTISTLLRMVGNASRTTLIGIIIYLIFASVIVALLLFSLRKIMQKERAAAKLASFSRVRENSIIFPTELEFEYGTLTLRLLSVRRHSIKEFKAEKKEKARRISVLDEEFRLIITPEGEGFASFPAVKILSRPYEGVMLLFMANKGTVICRKSLSIPTSKGSVYLDVEGKGKKLLGRIYSTPEKSIKVKILLSIPEGGNTEVKIAGGTIREFKYNMLPDEKILIYASYGALSLGEIARKLRRNGVVLGHGEFLIRFAVEDHFKKRYSRKESFKVVMKNGTWGI